jgi:hypothetical protein
LELQVQIVKQEAEAACELLATIMDALSIVKTALEAMRTEQEREGKEKSAETERMGTMVTGLKDEVSILEATRVALQISFTTLKSELKAARKALTLADLERVHSECNLHQELQQYSKDLSTLKSEVEDIRKELAQAVFEANERSNSSAFKVREMIYELAEAHKDVRDANEEMHLLMAVQSKVLEVMEVAHKADGELEATAGKLFVDGMVFDASEWSSVDKIWVPSADKGEPQAVRGRCASLPKVLYPRSPPSNLGNACYHASSTVRLTGYEMQMMEIASRDAEIKEAADIIKSRDDTISTWNAQKEDTLSQTWTRDAEVKALSASMKIHEPCGLHSLHSEAALAARDAQIKGLKADLAALNNELDVDRQGQLEAHVKLAAAAPTKDEDGRVKLGAAPPRSGALLLPLASGGAQDALEFALQAKAKEVEDLQTKLVAVTQEHEDKLAAVKVLYISLSFSLTGYITLPAMLSLSRSLTLTFLPHSLAPLHSLSLSLSLSRSLLSLSPSPPSPPPSLPLYLCMQVY